MKPSRKSSESSRRHFLAAGAAAATLAWSASPAPATAADADLRKPAKPCKLGIASYTFRKFDLDKTLAMTKRAGLEYVCLKSFHLPLDATPEQCREAAEKVKQAGLKLYGCGVVTMQKQEQIDQAFDYAKAAGMKMIVAAPSAEMLPAVDKKVKEFDIVVAIHNHGPGDKHFPTPESIYEKVKGFDKRIGLCIDIGHTVRIGADLLGSTRKYADRLYDVHIKDVTAAEAKGHGCEMGRGVIDIPAFLRVLQEIKYDGVIGFEYEEQADDPLPGLAESVGYTRGVLDSI